MTETLVEDFGREGSEQTIIKKSQTDGISIKTRSEGGAFFYPNVK